MTSITEKVRLVNGAGARLQLPVGRLRFGPLWLLILPGAAWAIAALLIPIVDASLTATERWSVAAVTSLLIVTSAAVHASAHLWAARALGTRQPAEVPVTVFGDPAQVWPDSERLWQDVMTAAAGPVVSGLLAWACWIVWNVQPSAYVNDAALVLAIFNLVLAASNVAPVHPFDGARVAGALLRGLGGTQLRTAGLATVSGYVLALAVAGWGLFLLSQRVRFSAATASIAFVVAALILVTLISHRASPSERVGPVQGRKPAFTYLRLPLATPVIAAMFVPFAGLMPVNEGIQAPGSAISTEEMVHVPEDVRHEMSGSLLLTTIILQTPIVAFEWAAARMSPVIELVPPERVVPAGTTPQSVARRNYNALVTSEETAAVVAVRLAGYEVTTSSDGAFVNSVSPDSPSSDVIQPGDVITAFNGQPVTSAQELIELTRAADPAEPVTLRVTRDGQEMDLTIELIPPGSTDGTPRIGISIETAGLTYDLPFPVEITPRKIAGGPSAGLMFTLTVYDLLTEEDLTGGRKIAGTGTIDASGNVGPIGGVEQKVAAAERAGAEYFLCPEQNYADAAAVAKEIEVVQVTTAEEAIEFLTNLPPK